MLPTLRRLASSPSAVPLNSTTTVAAQLLPPLQLYRRLLRAHRALPAEMRGLGDDYVKSEFRRTKAVDNPLQLVGFLGQWKLYLDQLEGQQDDGQPAWRGQKLDTDTLGKLSPEQLGQLYELLQATKQIYGQQETQDALEALQRNQ